MKHVDLLAVGALLLGMAIYSNARAFVAFEFSAPKRISFFPREHRLVTVPRISKICFVRH